MKVILIEGEENTGKSTLFRKILKELVKRPNVKDEYVQDFWGFYEIEGKKVILNSFSDELKIIREFKEFYKKYKDECDVLVTAIRPKEVNSRLHNAMKKAIYEADKSEQEIVIRLEKKDKIEQDKYLEEKYKEFLLEWNKI
ncbi:hypothetical protein CGC54_02530 [Capnocytophaga canimorsus]|uniref:Uncharacterized protein n=1 Tax=Capnocytophaga canimorsus TaxID=28188 RepID=A0AAD0E9I2_9FLAO|nr:hypothetical protein [Capnocytophaga canimorsus]ATA93292.1 hypothetical protein CGC54_02530 [Capnocytophaga canimorsus]